MGPMMWNTKQFFQRNAWNYEVQSVVSGDQTSKKHGELFIFSSLKGIASFVKILIVSGGKSSELYLHGKSVQWDQQEITEGK